MSVSTDRTSVFFYPASEPSKYPIVLDCESRRFRLGVVKTLFFHSWSSPSPSSEHPLLPYLHTHFLEWLVVDGYDFTTHIELGKYKKILQKKSRFVQTVHKQAQKHGKLQCNHTDWDHVLPVKMIFHTW
jgi:hypothetical protein